MNNHEPSFEADAGKMTAMARWQQLNGRRQGMLRRFERYASVTIPKVCLPDNVDQDSESIQYDWQSVGAQAVNHLTNKISMALFNPLRPFFRLEPDQEFAQDLAARGVTEDKLREALVGGEQRAMRVLDRRAVRPKLHNAFRHLIVVGNGLLDLSDPEAIRFMGIKSYCAKRSCSGAVQEILIHERMFFDELDEDVQAAVNNRKKPGDKVSLFKWARREGKRWMMTQWLNAERLPDRFSGSWSLEKFPYHVLTWDLADEHDYGTGLVEEYSGDFNALSVMSESEIKSAVLASEFRWLADPSGITDVNDFKKSLNGDVLPGRKDDLTLVHMTNTSALTELASVSEKIIRRIGAAFLLGSATTRDAERVTAEELRQQASELESSLGGVYSRLAVDIQIPLAHWLLKEIGVEVSGTKLQPIIITGLDALSRNADAANLVLSLQDLGAIATLPEAVQRRLQLGPVIATIFGARGLQPTQYVKPEEQVQQELQAQQAAAMEAEAQAAVAQEGARALADRATQPANEGTT